MVNAEIFPMHEIQNNQLTSLDRGRSSTSIIFLNNTRTLFPEISCQITTQNTLSNRQF